VHSRIHIALLLAVALLLGGCQRAPSLSPEETAVRSTIERYNQMLIEGYRALNMNGMRQVATQLQSEDEYIYMSSLAEGGVRLDPEIKQLEFVDVSVEATTATAETRETWDYRHYSRSTGELVLEEKGLIYHLAWDLEKQPDGSWLVSDMRAISATSTTEPSRTGTITPMPSEGK